jgi:hypothetical protein
MKSAIVAVYIQSCEVMWIYGLAHKNAFSLNVSCWGLFIFISDAYKLKNFYQFPPQ